MTWLLTLLSRLLFGLVEPDSINGRMRRLAGGPMNEFECHRARTNADVAIAAAERWCRQARELERQNNVLLVIVGVLAIAAAWGWLVALGWL